LPDYSITSVVYCMTVFPHSLPDDRRCW